jgi:transcriptional regulator with XRE-family HTH domain
MIDIRLAAGLTQRDLATRLGKTQAHIATLESGAYEKCGIGILRSVARALGVDLMVRSMFAPVKHGYGGSAADPA